MLDDVLPFRTDERHKLIYGDNTLELQGGVLAMYKGPPASSGDVMWNGSFRLATTGVADTLVVVRI